MPEEKKNAITDEQWVRIGVGLGHSIGGILASAFGAGALVQPMGQLEDQIITMAYGDKMAPSAVVNNQARVTLGNQSQAWPTQPTGQTPPIASADPKNSALTVYGVNR